jgi:hypothetical protein
MLFPHPNFDNIQDETVADNDDQTTNKNPQGIDNAVLQPYFSDVIISYFCCITEEIVSEIS